jgi:hypothetical protein
MSTRTFREWLTRAAALAAAAVMAVMLFAGAEEAGQQSLVPGPYLDKVAHAGYFGVFALAVDRGLAVRTVIPAIAAAFGLGAADELHQRDVPGRDSNVLDWCADAFGAVAAVAWRWRRRRRGEA